MRSGKLRTVLGAAVYPALMAASIWAACVALDARIDGGSIVLAVNVAAALVVFSLERALPYRTVWNRSFGDVRTDALHLVLNGVAGEVGRTVAVFSLTLASIHLSASLGSALWPSSWPLAAQVALALPIAELGVYWLHRFEHGSGFLWRLHAVHHSAPRLYFLNASRNHLLDAAISLPVLIAPLVLLGAGERVLVLSMVIWAVHALLQHSNVDVRLGPLNWLVSMAEVHRYHHSRDIDESNANYGQTLLVWDLVFGTRRVPVDRAPPVDVGLYGSPVYPSSWLGQVASPFDEGLWRTISEGIHREAGRRGD